MIDTNKKIPINGLVLRIKEVLHFFRIGENFIIENRGYPISDNNYEWLSEYQISFVRCIEELQETGDILFNLQDVFSVTLSENDTGEPLTPAFNVIKKNKIQELVSNILSQEQ